MTSPAPLTILGTSIRLAPVRSLRLILNLILSLSLMTGLMTASGGRAMSMDGAVKMASASCHDTAGMAHMSDRVDQSLMSPHKNHRPSGPSDGSSHQKSGFNCCTPQCQLTCDPQANITEVPRASQRYVLVSVPAHRAEAVVDAPKARLLRPPISA